MLVFEPIHAHNLDLIRQFLLQLGTGAQTFRYFAKRPVDIVLNHFLAVVAVDEGQPVAYGHLEREGDQLWLGIAVAESQQGRGIGKQMLQYLLDYARQRNEPVVTLTVDKDNTAAIGLYERVGFTRVADQAHFYKYQLAFS